MTGACWDGDSDTLGADSLDAASVTESLDIASVVDDVDWSDSVHAAASL